MCHSIPRWRLVFAALLVLGPVAFASPAEPATPDLRSLPGYLDPDKLAPFGNPDQLTVEVNLQGPLIQFVAEAAKGADPELSAAVAKVKSVLFRLYQLAPEDLTRLRKETSATASSLEQRGWQRVVWAKTGQSVNYLYLKMDGNRIVGLTALFIDQDNQLGIINLAGEIDPVQVGKIGQRFNIEALTGAQGSLPPKAGATSEER